MDRKLISLFTLVFIIVFALSACAPTDVSEPVAEKPADEEPVEKVTTTAWFYTSPAWECFIDGPIADFNEQSDTVFVEGVTKGQEARDAVQLALAGGGGPDILIPFGPSLLQELVEAGQVLALDPYVEEYGWDETIAPWALELGRIDGSLYALPVEIESFAIWYNKTMFEERGWEVPTTMTELDELSATIQAEGIIPFAGGTGDCKACNEWYFGEFVNHVAGPEKVYQALNGDIPWTDPAFVRSIETLRDMMQKGYWMGGVDRFFTATFDEFTAAFASGEAAMNLEGTWFPGRAGDVFDETGQEWDWFPVPSESGKEEFSIGVGGIRAINSAAENPDAAAEWLTYEFSPEVQAYSFKECGIPLAPVKVDESLLEGTDPRIARLMAAVTAAQDDNRYGYTAWTFWGPKSEVFAFEEIQKVLTGDMTVEDFLQGLDDAFQEDLEAGMVPLLPKR